MTILEVVVLFHIIMATLLETNTRARCEVLVSAKVQSGFHQELGMSEATYRNSFQDAVESLVGQEDSEQGVLALVEERISFVRQVELLGIDIDPGIFYEVVHHQDKKPYGMRLAVIAPRAAFVPGIGNYVKALANLPADLRPATPFEGINGEVEEILARSFVALPGGDYKELGILTGGSRRFLCLDRYLGKPRISHVRFNGQDPLVGILAARK